LLSTLIEWDVRLVTSIRLTVPILVVFALWRSTVNPLPFSINCACTFLQLNTTDTTEFGDVSDSPWIQFQCRKSRTSLCAASAQHYPIIAHRPMPADWLVDIATLMQYFTLTVCSNWSFPSHTARGLASPCTSMALSSRDRIRNRGFMHETNRSCGFQEIY